MKRHPGPKPSGLRRRDLLRGFARAWSERTLALPPIASRAAPIPMRTHAKPMWHLLTAVLLSAIAFAQAQAAADLRGGVFLPGGTLVPPGVVAKVVLSVTNLGPDSTAGSPGMGTVFTPNVGHRDFALLRLPESAPCDVRYIDFVAPPGQLSTTAVSISTGRVLAPSESASCILGLLTFPESPAIQTLRLSFGPLSEDPDTSNNRVNLEIRTGASSVLQRPAPIPASESLALLLLAGGMLAVGAAALRRAG